MFDLKGKAMLITGAASGIGEAAAIAASSVGAFVYVADLDRDNGARVVAHIIENGGAAEFIYLNVADDDNCNAVAQKILADKGKLDILVNNAGIGHVGTMLETDAADLDRLYNVNVRGVFVLTKAFLPSMLEKGSGVVINLASVGGIAAISERLAYCTTKFAVVGFTKALALDHAKAGIRANAVCPGRVETPFVKKRIAEYSDPKAAYEQMAATQALGRMATPEEIAAAIVYLASDEAAFITGTAFEIDGGFSLGK